MSPRIRCTLTYALASVLLLAASTLIAAQLGSHGVPAALLAVCAIGVPLALWEQISDLVYRIAHPTHPTPGKPGKPDEDDEDGEAFGLAS